MWRRATYVLADTHGLIVWLECDHLWLFFSSRTVLGLHYRWVCFLFALLIFSVSIQENDLHLWQSSIVNCIKWPLGSEKSSVLWESQNSLFSFKGLPQCISPIIAISHKDLSDVQIKNLHDYIAQKNQEDSDDDDWEEWKLAVSNDPRFATFLLQ